MDKQKVIWEDDDDDADDDDDYDDYDDDSALLTKQLGKQLNAFKFIF